MTGTYTPTIFNEYVATEARKLVGQGKFVSGVAYHPVSVTFTNTEQMSKEVFGFLHHMTMDQKEEITTYTRTEVLKHVIAPKTRVLLYQRVFEAPGMVIHERTTKMVTIPLTKEEVVEKIPMQMMMKPMMFVKGLKVVYSDSHLDAPTDRIRDVFGGSDEINYMYGGKYVWLVPMMTTMVSEAINHFDLVITSNADPHHDDLAKGAGGAYRYLIPVKKTTTDLLMTELTLARFSSDVHLLLSTMFYPHLPKGFTTDINMERGGEYLYLVWKLQKVYVV
ncbi:hypothetical protein C0989_000460 [Termitomyces sp. Mn162]|nr:hypothetical protein C0989_000460 [Termitomyces sp. Mn162]